MSKVTVAVNIVIVDEHGKYLLQMRDGTEGIRDPLKWGFFGGGMKRGESPRTAAQRELKEELDINSTIKEFELIGSSNPRQDKVVHALRLRRDVTWGDFLVREGAGAGFFTKDEVERLQLSQAARSVLPLL